MTNIDAKERGLSRYSELSETAQKQAYECIAMRHLYHDKILDILSKHWWSKDGYMFVGSV